MKKVGTVQKNKDKKFVENSRDPAKFNGETFAREYGGVPK
jgi:hypothetical protein